MLEIELVAGFEIVNKTNSTSFLLPDNEDKVRNVAIYL